MSLSATAQKIRDRIKSQGLHSPHGQRQELSRAMVEPLRTAAQQYRDLLARRATLKAQIETAKADVEAKVPPVSEVVFAEIARTAREDGEFNAYLSTLALTGSKNEQDVVLLRALAMTPHARLFKLTDADRSAAIAQLKGQVEEDPTVAPFLAALEEATFNARQLRAQLRELEPDLDRETLVKAGVLVANPHDLSDAHSQEWKRQDPLGWAYSVAGAGREFQWADPRVPANRDLPSAA
jgi:hypothetical protein